jgi:hypothetical protein
MKPCCIESAKRYLKKNRDVATCDRCRFLLMAYTHQGDVEETVKNLKSWGGEFCTIQLANLYVVVKARSVRKSV